MNPSYFRIRLPIADAIQRFAKSYTVVELEPPREVQLLDAVTRACDEQGNWRGSALYVYENDGWTVFEDLTGRWSARPADSWLPFVHRDDFVFAGYNDAIGYGELIVIADGAVLREFLTDPDNPEVNVDRGHLTGNPVEPLETWIQAARFVDDDEVVFSEHGLLWLHE